MPHTLDLTPPRRVARAAAVDQSYRAGRVLPNEVSYVRARDLPRLLPMWPGELAAMDRAQHARLLTKLRKALRAERQRGLGAHWTYDVARHAQLLRAYRAEAAAYLQSGMQPDRADLDADRARAP
jgi:hypothetical protein